MMFDTLVRGEEEEEEVGPGDFANMEIRLCDMAEVGEEMEGDRTEPIMRYLRNYYISLTDRETLLESATDPDLSWDEGDMPNTRIQIWTFNDFMEQYNNLYSWLNNIQVQYHMSKRKDGGGGGGRLSARVETLLRDLERDVARRERFLRECGRMVGACPHLEEEVGWRLEHVLTKWDMLAALRLTAGRPSSSSNNNNSNQAEQLPEMYSDIELEVRCLRKWLKEMELRIDPLQFSKAAEWSPRDRERKMAEYHVLQTDIEAHGRIVKLVLGLCEDLSLSPGHYDAQHAVKVAKGLERRWHQIWLRSLEWQCLLEQWVQQEPVQREEGEHEEPLNKIPRLSELCCTPNFSPAATLLRMKKRKRQLAAVEPQDTQTKSSPTASRGKASPRARRRLLNSSEKAASGAAAAAAGTTCTYTSCEDSEEDEVTTMATASSPRDVIVEKEADVRRHQLLSCLSALVANESQRWSTPNPTHQLTYWDSSDREAFGDTSCDDDQLIDEQQTISIKGLELMEEQHTISMEGLELPTAQPNSFQKTQLRFVDEDRSSGDYSARASSTQDCCHSNPDPVEQEEVGAGEGDEEGRGGGGGEGAVEERSSPSLSGEGTWTRPNRKLKRKFRKRSLADTMAAYESQSEEEELESACAVLAQSKYCLHTMQAEARLNLTQDTADELIGSCSAEMNSLTSLIARLESSDSFLSKKKRREARILLSRWESLRQNLVEAGATRQLLADIRSATCSLRQNIIAVASHTPATKPAMHMDTMDQQDLGQRLYKFKEDLQRLEQYKADLSHLNLSVSNLIAQLVGNSGHYLPGAEIVNSHVLDGAEPASLAKALEEEVVGLYHLWERSYHSTSSQVSATEETLLKMEQFERELSSLRSLLRKEAIKVKVGNNSSSSCCNDTNDSGISDASSCSSSSGSCCLELDFPLRQQQMERLRFLAKHLQQSLEPTSKASTMISKNLESTSHQLKTIQKSYQRLKLSRMRAAKRSSKQLQQLPSAGNKPASGSRMRRTARAALSISLVLVLLLLLSWGAEPRCCDSYTTAGLSFSPQLKYVNGPPPI